MILETYLFLLENENNLDTFLSDYKVITYSDPKDIETGLLRYKEPPKKGTAFLFKFPEEEILHFHTIGMKFPINVSFWNSKKEVVYVPGISKPGIKDISSMSPAKYAVEIPVYNN
jgi:uncharacterized membrane protein (UPF0127 family)